MDGFARFIDGVAVAEARALSYSHVGEAVTSGVARGFDLSLPLEFADGRVRRVRVVDDIDRELPGSPCPVVAFPRGLEQFLESQADLGSERLRAGLFDRLAPQSLPPTEFAAWAHAFPPTPAFNAPRGSLAVTLIGDERLEDTLESLDQQNAGAAFVGALRAGAEPMTFEAADLAAFLESEGAEAEIIVFAPSGTRFHPNALGRFAEALARFPEAALAYCDIVLADDGERQWPLAFSAFDYERQLEQGYAAFCFAARAAHVRAALKLGVGDLFRLFNCAFDAYGPAATHPAGSCAGLPGRPASRRTCARVGNACAGDPRTSGGAQSKLSGGAPGFRSISGGACEAGLARTIKSRSSSRPAIAWIFCGPAWSRCSRRSARSHTKFT